MSLRSKLKGAWEQKKLERDQNKKMEQEIYERKKYAREMESSASRFEKRQEKAESKAEFRASGGYGGALKRGAKQTGKGFARMGSIAGEKAKTEIKKGFKSTGKRMKTGMKGYAKNPFGSGMGGGFDMFGSTPKTRKKSRSGSPQIVINVGGSAQRSKGKRRKGKKRSSDPFNIFGNIKL